MGLIDLDRFANNEKVPDFVDYSLDNIRAIASRMGNPHLNVPAIHIAGTNGKGSVAHMLHAIFKTAGYRCGLYTSPHLAAVNERFIINGDQISNTELDRYVDKILSFIDTAETVPTYFDIVTLIAFEYFKENNVNVAVIETGLGGAKDSTNIVEPAISIITDISLDHVGLLGNTIEKIAWEKSGIIKEKVPVITSNNHGPAKKVIQKTAAEKNAPLYILDSEFNVYDEKFHGEGYSVNYHCAIPGISLDIHDITIPFFGKFQLKNAALAITAALVFNEKFKYLSKDISGEIGTGMQSVTVPGRFETLSHSPTIIFDPAHNESAFLELFPILHRKFFNREILFVITLMRDKDHAMILEELANRNYPVLYYQLHEARCYNPLVEPPPDRNPIRHIVNSVAQITEYISSNYTQQPVVIFTGSFRLYEAASTYSKRINNAENFPQ